ncbi:MAG: glycerate kinase [Nanoarchaeota archaeon]|nr:glycerate kinase [Nanoarchaeota archaeon]
MKVLIAPGPYKECLGAEEVANALSDGLSSVLPHLDVEKFPMCDGGTGFTKILVQYTGGKIINSRVLGPLGYEINASFGILGDKKTAVIESATTQGLSLVPIDQRNPLVTTSYGTGQLIKEARKYGCKKILVGCGDSSTNDGGVGAMQALGTRFLDKDKRDIGFGGAQLLRINEIDNSSNSVRKNLEIIVACNLTSVLTGEDSVSRIYSPQKGADSEGVKLLERGIEHLVRKLYETFHEDVGALPGGGGSGGLAGALYALAGSKLRYSMEVVSEVTDLQKKIEGVDMIITGEGKIDSRTATGKIACGVALYGKRLGIPTIAVVGQIDKSAEEVYYNGIDFIESITTRPISQEESMKNAKQYIFDAGARIARLINLGNYEKKIPKDDSNGEKLDTIIFDLGKTLIHTPEEFNLENRLAAQFDFSDSGDARKLIYSICNLSYHGLTHEGFVIKLTEKLQERFDGVDEKLVRKFCEEKATKSILSETALDVLNNFKGRGYTLALVSNATPITKTIIKNFELESFFDAISLSCDVGYLKPDPRIFQTTIANLGKKPSQVCVVGDKIRTDILGAKIIGARTILLERNSKKVVENDLRIPIDAMIPSLDDMINLSMFD